MAQKLDALEQRLARIGGEVEHARVQVEPRELAVEQGVARSLGGRAAVVAKGPTSSPNGGERGVSIW